MNCETPLIILLISVPGRLSTVQDAADWTASPAAAAAAGASRRTGLQRSE